MTYVLGARSRARLVGVHPNLVKVVERALAVSAIDFTVIEGLRTHERQVELYAQGRTKPGPKVTWTMQSKHLKQADGFGHDVDVGPLLPGGGIDWQNTKGFDAISIAMFAAAEELGVRLRWGADWDRDGVTRERGETDSPHFEI